MVILLYCGIASSTSAQAYRTEFYSEGVYLGRESVAAHTLSIRSGKQISASVYPYLQIGQELMTTSFLHPEAGEWLDPGGSYAYLGPGARLNWGDFSFWGELRARSFYRRHPSEASPQRSADLRGVLTHGRFFETRPVARELSLFAESYAEMVFTSGDLGNIILTGFVRGGLRWKISTRTALDVFLEPFLSLDRVRHYYYNRTDLKPSLRLGYYDAHFGIGLTCSYIFEHYFSRGDFEANPYADRNSGVRFLAVVGGAL